jgi:cyclopropane-fatty-acyl-phospholipid synthase
MQQPSPQRSAETLAPAPAPTTPGTHETRRGSAEPRRAATPVRRPRGLQRPLRGAVLSRLKKITWGQLVLDDALGREVFGRPSPDAPMVRVWVHDPEMYVSVGLAGTVGVGSAFAAGLWDTDDLTGLVRIFARNREALATMDSGLARLSQPALSLLHALRRNTRAGSRANIAKHYDLGNELFERMLDPTMMYSCGIYERGTETLEEASVAKLDRIAKKLDLKPTDHLLEIGTGWGGMAIHAAERYGCRVTTTTISREQHEFAVARIAERGLQDRIEVLFRDYRDLEGQFDKLVSIEMVEAIGHKQYPTYLRTISERLKPQGRALIQAITIQDQEYDRAKNEVDFIKRYIFPGCCIPSVTALVEAMRDHSDLRLSHLEDITPHYARTLRDWRENLARHGFELSRLGYDKSFQRLWEYYLCYCEGAFEERVIHDLHLVFAKPLDRSAPLMGAL